jgi:phosphoribosylanthranilate isomerase
MKVKICGVRTYEDAVMALDNGADALGFNFYPPSPRHIHPEAAATIARGLPPFAVRVGVFCNVPTPGEVVEIARVSGIQVLQLHGDESPDYCQQLKSWPLIKALRIGREVSTDDLSLYGADAFLLDGRDEKLFGGTGNAFDWSHCESLNRWGPIILAGGLRPENVADAIRLVRPYAVDVCSGVESAPGQKSLTKLAAFMDEVRNAR